jgi:predicted dehydrogenase
MEKYRAAIVGLGRIAAGFESDPLRIKPASHTGGYLAHKRINLIAVCDTDNEKLDGYGRQWGVKRLYNNFDEMLRKERIDILSVCTWNSSHKEIVQKAVAAGVKAVFCEKPLSDSLKNADSMAALCRKTKTVLAVNHWRRWDAFHNRLKELIDKGTIGDVQSATFYYTAGIANTGTHLLDLLRYFFGDVSWVWAHKEKKYTSMPDPCLDGYMYFKNGFGCALKGCEVKSYLVFELDVLGTKGRIRLYDSGDKATLWLAEKSKMYSGYQELYEKPLPFGNPHRAHFLNSIQDIVACIESGRQPACSGEDGVAALELIAALHLSAKKGIKVALPLKNRTFRIISK